MNPITLTCPDCKKERTVPMRADLKGLIEPIARCHSCAGKFLSKKESWRSHIAKRTESRWTEKARTKQSKIARRQLISQGGVPNAVKFTKGSTTGPLNNRWKGGITPATIKERFGEKRKVWLKAVMSRDKHTCQICKVRGGKLHVHHIKKWSDYPELRFDVDNGVTLCENCHVEIVHKGAWRNEPIDRETLNWYISQDAVVIDWAA